MYDKEIGMYYLIARYYHPEHGVFLSVDPDPGDDDDPITQNAYTYAHNNPVMKIDADGNHPVIVAAVYGYRAYKVYKYYNKAKKVKKLTGVKKNKDAVIYLRKNLDTGRYYVGRTKSWSRFERRKQEHATKNGQNYKFTVIARAKNKRQAKRYEQKWINRLGGKKNFLENGRDEIQRKKWKSYYV